MNRLDFTNGLFNLGKIVSTNYIDSEYIIEFEYGNLIIDDEADISAIYGNYD